MCPEPLEPGQVWELRVIEELEPSLLLFHYLDEGSFPYWRCLALRSGTLLSATPRRWERDQEPDPLVGRRLL